MGGRIEDRDVRVAGGDGFAAAARGCACSRTSKAVSAIEPIDPKAFDNIRTTFPLMRADPKFL